MDSDGHLLKNREKRAGGPGGIYGTEHITYDLCSDVGRLSHIQLQGRGPGPVEARRDGTVSPEPMTHRQGSGQRIVWGCTMWTHLPSRVLTVLSPSPQHILAGHNILF